jgi:hypothetical protein
VRDESVTQVLVRDESVTQVLVRDESVTQVLVRCYFRRLQNLVILESCN